MRMRIDPRPADGDASSPAPLAGRFRIALFAALLLLLAAVGSRSARADEVTGYDPAEMQSGVLTDVTVRGSGFGRTQGNKCVLYGHGHERIGNPPILSWGNTAVRVTMGRQVPPGTYWLAIARPNPGGDCRDLRSNLLETFRVTAAPEGGGGGGGAGVPRDLAIVGVTPGIGTEARVVGGRVNSIIRVRNKGTQAQTFALTDGRPRTHRGPLGAEIRQGIETTPSTRLAPGATVNIPMSFSVAGGRDAFTQRVWIVSPGAIPTPFLDANGRDNEVTIWYRLRARPPR